MARFLRSYSAEPVLRKPIGLSPLAKPGTPGQLVVSVNTASGLLTNQRRAQQRRTRSFLSPPILTPAASGFIAAPIDVNTVATATRNRYRLVRGTASLGVGPINGLPAANITTVAIYLAGGNRLTRRAPRSFLRKPTVVATGSTFIAPPLVVIPPFDHGRRRRRPLSTNLSPPQFYPQTSTIQVNLASGLLTNQRRAQQRRTRSFLGALIFYRQSGVISVTLASGLLTNQRRLQQRKPYSRLGEPFFYAQTSEIQAATVRTRPRKTQWFLTSVTYPQVTHLVEAEVAVTTVQDDRRKRQTHSKLSPPFFYAQTSDVTVTSVRTRPRPTTHRLTAVSYPATSVIFVKTVSTRPRPKRVTLLPPTVLQTFPGPVEVEVSVKTVQDDRRRRAPRSFATKFVTYPQTSVISTRLVATRPRKTRSFLTPPFFYAQSSVIRTTTVRTRPRPTTKFLNKPTVLQTFGPPVEVEVFVKAVVDDRQRRRSRSFAITPVVSAQTSEISVTTTRIRPRKTRTFLTSIVYAATSDILVQTTRTRPRPTRTFFIAVPPERIPSVEQREQTLMAALVRTKPRPTRHFLNPPTVVRVPAVEQAEDTIRVSLVRTRPRPTTRKLAPPTVIVTNPPVVTTLKIVLVAVPTRAGYRREVVEHFLSPPTKVIPLPTLRMQTVTVTLVRTRPRPTHARLTAVSYRATSVIQTHSVRIRPRPTTHRLQPPATLQVFRGPVETEVAVTTVQEDRRRRATRSFAIKPVTYPQTTPIRVATVRTRPRHTLSVLAPPAVVATTVFAPILVKTPVRDFRHRGIHSTLRPPVFSAQTSEISVTLVRTRPRKTSYVLGIGIARQVVETRRLSHLVQPPLRPIRSTLRPPTILAAPAPPTLAQTTLSVNLTFQPTPRTKSFAIKAKVGRQAPQFTVDTPGSGWEVRTPRADVVTDDLDGGWETDRIGTDFDVDSLGVDWEIGTPE